MMQELRRRVLNIVSRAVVTLVDDTLKMQGLQLTLLEDEVREQVERFQQYGFTSVPFAGAEALVLAVGGNRDHLLAIAIDDRRSRKRNLQPGEVALYTDQGDSILLKRGRIVEVTAGTKVRVVAPLVEMTGNLTVAGDITVTGDVIAGSVHLKTHKHAGVQSGGAQTSTPV